MPVDRIPDRFRPKFCEQCAAPMRQGSAFNLFICQGVSPHERWVQSPPVAYVVIVDERLNTVLVRRGIPPSVGSFCFPGGYIDFGDTTLETVVHEAMDEALVRINPHRTSFLGEWFEPAPGVTVRILLAYVSHDDILPFVPNKEATERFIVNIFELDPAALAFNGNRLALEEAIKRIQL